MVRNTRDGSIRTETGVAARATLAKGNAADAAIKLLRVIRIAISVSAPEPKAITHLASNSTPGRIWSMETVILAGNWGFWCQKR